MERKIYTVSHNNDKVCNIKAVTIGEAFNIIENISYDMFKELLHMRFDLDNIEHMYNERNQFSYTVLPIIE